MTEGQQYEGPKHVRLGRPPEPRQTVYAAVLDDRVQATAGSVQGALIAALDQQAITLKNITDGEVQIWTLIGRAGFEVTTS